MARKLAVAVTLAILVFLSGLPLTPTASTGRPGTVLGLTPGGGDWLAAVQRDVARSEYQITWQERTDLPDLPAAYQAPNRAHNLRTYFTPSGVRVIPRTTDGSAPAWEWRLRLIGFGVPGNVRATKPAHLAVERNRIEYRRAEITEWYVNDPRGLEQGFTLGRAQGDGPVLIDLTLEGTLTPAMTADGRSIELTTSGGVTVLQYGQLQARDSAGRILPSQMGLPRAGPGTGSIIRIVVDATAAVYPITVDPLSTAVNWSAEGNQASAGFGFSVATAGDVNGDGYSDVIVGANRYDNGQIDEGRVFVYRGSANGLATSPSWTLEANQAGARFGASVATAGDVNGDGYSDVIIGAPGYDNGQSDEGRVFVYHGSSIGLPPSPNWVAEGNQPGAGFGTAVATAGDINGDGYSDVIVGAPTYDNEQTDEGRAFLYRGSATGLAVSPGWTAEGNQVGANFGGTVATAGDVNGDGFSDFIVGAPMYDNGQSNEGRTFLYRGSAGTLTGNAVWQAEGNQAGARFGAAAATAGDVDGDGYADVIIGAPTYDSGQANEGRVSLYRGSSSGLGIAAAWTAEGNQSEAQFGLSVSTAGDVNGDGYADVLVGAPFYDSGKTDEGRVVAYFGSSGGLGSLAWMAERHQASASFGSAVATAGDVNGDGYSDVIIGAYRYDSGQADEGRAFVYQGFASGLSATANWTVVADWNTHYLGSTVGPAGDVNGDGYADVIVGADRVAKILVYHGSENGLNTTAAWQSLESYAAGTVGDVNGDGYADVLVSNSAYANGQTNEGRALLYYGSPGGLSVTPSWVAESNNEGARFGSYVGTAGDVNGDGFSDMLIAANHYTAGQWEEGKVFVYHGSPNGPALTPSWTVEGNRNLAEFGRYLAAAGDVNGDGYSDLVVSDTAFGSYGRLVLYYGSANGLGTSPAWTKDGDATNRFWLVSSVGDVNGDGYADVLANGVGSGGGLQAVFAFYGSATGLGGTPAWTVQSSQAGDFFGYAIATAGDINGDGFADVLVGAPYYDGSNVSEGRVFVYLGSASGLETKPTGGIVAGDQKDVFLGSAVATAGDVNGDAYADVILGSGGYQNGPFLAQGRAYLHYGNGGPAVILRPQQWRRSSDKPIAPLGKSDTGGSFRILGRLSTPFGRGLGRLEWEVKPLGTLFNGSGTGRSAWLDTGVSGFDLTQVISGLTTGRSYHWRVRFLYHTARLPFQQHSRWFTMPWNGWNEKDLRTK